MIFGCSTWEALFSVIIIIFTIWNDLSYSQWVVLTAAVLLLVHALSCKHCGIRSKR